ncbi:DUF4328 domain-containing protein [Wenjunlia tyrosinilytica]|uniref:DUF4328 domain-containing protein n=1 Tax=Wenjunlia tyrosinilytica TaxID=1544741 RepID=A0A917ZI80_9ACTN|nr:DUF4328 domain-containing protein [Wenjunlia tyrosinilytica]GGO83451.1 hypothetical protein GCM10012280_12480 [Wenjunlia tyrosinilytica]
MLCQRCHAAQVAPGGYCPSCGALSAWAPPPAPYAPYLPPAPAPVRIPSGLANALTVLLGLNALAQALALGAAAIEFVLFGQLETDPGGVDAQDARAADSFYAVTGVGGLLLLLATGVVFIVWFHRVRRNAAAFVPVGWHRLGPGWTIGAWFTPVVNLWFPKQIADDVWSAGDPATGAGPYRMKPTSGPPLVLWWWLAWVAGNLLSWVAVAIRSGTSVTDFSAMRWSYGIDMAGALVSVAAAVLAIVMVRRITTMQGVRHAMLNQPPAYRY